MLVSVCERMQSCAWQTALMADPKMSALLSLNKSLLHAIYGCYTHSEAGKVCAFVSVSTVLSSCCLPSCCEGRLAA